MNKRQSFLLLFNLHFHQTNRVTLYSAKEQCSWPPLKCPYIWTFISPVKELSWDAICMKNVWNLLLWHKSQSTICLTKQHIENESKDQSCRSFTASKSGAIPTETKNAFFFSLMLFIIIIFSFMLKSTVLGSHSDLFWIFF